MMRNAPLPLVREVVLIGGGHTHALLLRRWGMSPVPGGRLTVVNPAPTAPYTGMLPGHVAGHYVRDDLEIDLVKLARFAGARIVFGMVDGIDGEARTVSIEGRPLIAYDIVSIDIGITSNMPDIKGFSEFAVAAKPLGPFSRKWRSFLDSGGGPVAVIGGGVAGVELALAMNHSLGEAADVTVLESERLLIGVGDSTRTKLQRAMDRAGIKVREGVDTRRIDANAVHLDNGEAIVSTFTVGAAGARPFPWLQDTGLKLEDGYIVVDAELRSSDPAIFAAGDCAQLSHAPRPKAGVFAVRAAPVLAHNIAAELTGRRHRSFRPQSHYLKLISLGQKSALAEKWGYSIGGEWAWRWKDWIDRRFMDRLNDPPRMTPQPLPRNVAIGVSEALGVKPLCGGCGSKVGPGTLDEVLAKYPALSRSDIEVGSGDDAAVLKFGETRQVISTDHLRAFWDDPHLMARIAAVHALGDIWAMGAHPQAALAQIVLPRMSETMQSTWLDEIMVGASDVFSGAGAEIVGGHTSLGAELAIGFTATGIADNVLLTLRGAREDDALILTRPIGSGVLLAGEMAGDARGGDVAAVLETMATQQGDSAARLRDRVHAMTDVTGFGLAGHLARMAKASGLSAEIELQSIPLYPGALRLSEAGTRSTIYPANRRAVLSDVPENALAALIFDPQTAGGFLASLPSNDAQSAVDDLRELGHEAAIIGRMIARTDVTLRVT